MLDSLKKKLVFPLALMISCAVIPSVALASGAGQDDLGLGDLLNWIIGLIQGTLGKILSLIAFLVGMIAGIAQGSFLAVATGIGFAVVFYYGPDIIISVFGATVSAFA